MPDRPFDISLFDNRWDNTPRSESLTWAEISARFRTPEIRFDKDGPLFSPARFEPARRLNANVKGLSLLTLDLDHDVTLPDVLSGLKRLGCAFLIYTTHSHLRKTDQNPNAEPRFRAVIPLETDVTPGRFPELWHWVKTETGLPIDEAAKDLSRMYYLPAVVSSGMPYEFVVHPGAFLKPSKAKSSATAPPAPTLDGIVANGNGNGHPAANGAAAATKLSGPPIVPDFGFELPPIVRKGKRDSTFIALAGKLRSAGLTPDEIELTLLAANKRVCDPPLAEGEVRKIARSAGRYDADRELTRIADDTISNCDDVSIATMFVLEHGHELQFNVDSKKWLVWDGTRWKPDKTDEVVRKAIDFAQKLYEEAPRLVKNKADMTIVQRQIKRSNTSNGIGAFVNLAKSILPVTSEQLDAKDYLLNCRNGVVNLETGELHRHNPGDRITKIVPFDFDPTATSPAFDKFLTTIQPDPEIRKFLQRSIGYSLLGVARERAFWILYGSGNNGKSVFIDLFSEILAEYASSTTSASVMAQKGDRIPNDIARLHGKRFVVIPETEENERINAALIKALSGGDKITARFLFGEFFDFYFSGKLWIATNHKPAITDHSKGFWDRLKIIRFSVDIPKAQVIKKDTLLKQLLADAPAVLNWAVQGAREYFAMDSLEVPDVIRSEIETYKYEQDSIAQFIDEACDVGLGLTINNAVLYTRYTNFCKDNGEWQRSQRRFTQNLKERGFTQVRTGNGRIWQGLTMKR